MKYLPTDIIEVSLKFNDTHFHDWRITPTVVLQQIHKYFRSFVFLKLLKL